MVLTDKGYYDFVVNLNKSYEEMLPLAIKKALSWTSLLFIGYNLEDITFRVIFQGIYILLNPGRDEMSFAVQPIPAFGPDANELVQQYLSTYATYMFKVAAYWGTASQFLQELRERSNFQPDAMQPGRGITG
jgi:hypothetical protein